MTTAAIDPAPHLLPLVEAGLDTDGTAFLGRARDALESKGASHLPVLFPQLARHCGRRPLGGSRIQVDTPDGPLDLDLGAWRVCDAVGALLLEAAGADDEMRVDLYRHGDIEERTAVLRAMAWGPVRDSTVELLGEIQRTNTTAHFEAGGLDSNLVARATTAGGPDAGFTLADLHRFVLKMAFSDLPIARTFGVLDHANAELSRMLQDFATEREAAGRAVWTDTNRFIARAPTEGSIARLIGGLENGDDPTRLAAAEGVLDLASRGAADAMLCAHAAARIPREPRPAIRAVLERIPQAT